MTPRQAFFGFSAIVPAAAISGSFIWAPLLWTLIPIGALIAIGMYDSFQLRHAILRQYPILGHGRYLAERFRPEIQQYFVESNTNGTPFSRGIREIVYRRAKGQRDKLPFGTQLDVYEPGYEFLSHSMYPKDPLAAETRVLIGERQCSQPYSASLLNISGMSFGALSAQAITALSLGAAEGGFAQNTGEGGVSQAHLSGGADLIWQIGTGYFGCRTPAGAFDPSRFTDQAAEPAIKAIEIKLSQGAKPGLGGILPAAKLTPDIAAIRGVEMGKDVISPPSHSAFSSPASLLEYLALLRNLSGGKPVGFKLCIGRPSEFLAVAQAMSATGLTPDFITIDGAEGGTGAAPPELSDSVGMPMREGLSFVHNTLIDCGHRADIRLIAGGKVATGFDIVRCLALGADLCGSARAMMLALGCIQARRCDSNECPVGVATQDPHRAQALIVADKAKRVTNFHRGTISNLLELIAAAGCEHPGDLELEHVNRRTDQTQILSYAQIYGPTPVAITRKPGPNHPALVSTESLL